MHLIERLGAYAGFAALDLIERLGAYAGFAAFFGLAVLALLYFSQARDVRRLREWAGRAPERAVETPTVAQHSLPPTTLEEATRRARRPLRERLRNVHVPQLRYVALVVGAVVILGGAGLAALQLVGNGSSDSTSNARRQAGSDHSGSRARRQQVNIDPAQVTVAVLNGTTIAGLAAQVGEEAMANGFTLGTVTNAARTDQTRSVVLYRRGERDAASAVADRLGVHDTRPVDPLSAELAGSFDVIVLVGSDRS
jgi:hypothetical protein